MPSHIISSPVPRTGETQARSWMIPVVVAIGGLLLTLILWQTTLSQALAADQLRFARLADRIQNSLSDRLQRHQRLLDSLRGLYSASKSVERAEFRNFVSSVNLPAYHGALGFGFIRYVPRDRLNEFLTHTRADDAPDFVVHPDDLSRTDLMIIEFIEPLATNRAAQGFDIGSETFRHQAAIRAVDENKAVLTQRITLIQGEKNAAGFLLLLPIFNNGAKITAAAERWRAVNGWVYVPIRIDNLMANLEEESAKEVDFEIFDTGVSEQDALLFDVNYHEDGPRAQQLRNENTVGAKLSRIYEIPFGGRIWQLQVSSLPAFAAEIDHRLPWLILLGGFICTGLVTFAANSSQRVRRQAVTIAENMTGELREEIAQREKLHSSLSELSNFQEAIVQSAGYAIISTTPEGLIRIFNPAAQRLLGYTEKETVGHLTPAIFHLPAEVEARAKEFSAELGLPLEPGFDVFVIKSCKGLPNEHEWTYVRKDGSHVPVMLSVTAIHDGLGGFSGYLGVAIDITERKRAWAELLQSQQASDDARREVELQRDALDQHAIVSIADPHGKILHANDRFCTISGFKRQELIGKTHRIINSGFHPASFWNNFWQTICAGNVWHGEICNRAKDGSLYWLNATVVPFHDAQGEISRFVAIRTDITARKRAETELRDARQIAESANQSKSEFLAEMSHEIRTPMNAVLGFTELLTSTALNDKQRSFVETIQLSGQNLLTIINDILDYSKIEAGKLEVERIDFDAINTIKTVVKTLSLQAKSKSLALILHSLPGTPHQVSADPTRVRQVLINLIGNALKFTKRGGVTVATELLPANGNPLLRFNVTDTGIGLSPEQQARLFTKFMQAKTSTTREFGGTGLGLAICKRLVELMGGEIGVTSTEGKGSTFWFTLPLATNNKPAESIAPPSPTHKIEPIRLDAPSLPATPVSTLRPARPWEVLVVDDNHINQQLACAFLGKLNCHFTTANNGAEAAKIVQQKTFDLVLMDYQMPEMDGMQATTAIRHWESAQPGRKRLPIIALTANLSPELSHNFIACGMDNCLAKPLMFLDLKEVIATLTPNKTPTNPSLPVPATVTSLNLSAPVLACPAPPTAMNRERALQLTDNNPVLLGMLAQAFLAQCDDLMKSIGLALKARDASALKSHAHKLKGSISVFAADAAHTIVLALNVFPIPPEWEKLDRLGQELEIEIVRLRPELVALTSPSPSSK